MLVYFRGNQFSSKNMGPDLLLTKLPKTQLTECSDASNVHIHLDENLKPHIMHNTQSLSHKNPRIKYKFYSMEVIRFLGLLFNFLTATGVLGRHMSCVFGIVVCSCHITFFL